MKDIENENEKKRQLLILGQQIRVKSFQMKMNAFEIGKLLHEARRSLPHGQFKKWVNSECDFSYTSANNFVNLYIGCLANPSVVKQIKTSLLYQITAPKFPKLIRDYIVNHPKCIQDVKVSKLQSFLRKYKGKKVDISDSDIAKMLGRFNSNEELYAYQNNVTNCIDNVQNLTRKMRPYASKVSWPCLPNKKVTGVSEKVEKRLVKALAELKDIVDAITPSIEVIPIELLIPEDRK